jgi:hypothetical protein
MPIKSDTTGLKTLTENAKKLDGEHQVLLLDLLSPEFMSAHTKSPDFLSFCESAGYKVETAEDLEAIPDGPWDAYIKSETEFENWLEMQKAAGAEYFAAQLFKGIKR